MEFDPRKKEAVDLVPEGWYEVLIIEGKTDVTRNGYERWQLKYEIKGVIDAKQTELALKFVGKFVEDLLLDMDNLQRKVSNFMRVVFPEIEEQAKEQGDSFEPPFIKAEEAVGRRMGVLIGIANGNPDYGDPEKVNRCWRYKKIGEPAGTEKKEEEADVDSII